MRVSRALLFALVSTACRQPAPAHGPPAAESTAPAAAPAPAGYGAAGPAPAPTAAAAPAAAPAAPAASASAARAPAATGPVEAGATVGPASVSGQVANADTLASGMQGDFTRCYASGLEADRQARGSVLVALQVGKDGAVTRVDTSSNGRVPASVESCIQARAKAARFSPPKGGGAIVSFSVALEPKPAAPAGAEGGTLHPKDVAVSPPGYEHGDRVATFVRAKARECYRDVLRIEARAEGKVSVAMWLDDKGVVTKVEALRTGTLPDTVTTCIKKRAQPARFPAPKTAPTVVTVPIRLALKPASGS